ncbi:MAG: hypothetical protein ACI9OJ_003451, partial [Myxococcota bacterium]
EVLGQWGIHGFATAAAAGDVTGLNAESSGTDEQEKAARTHNNKRRCIANPGVRSAGYYVPSEDCPRSGLFESLSTEFDRSGSISPAF